MAAVETEPAEIKCLVMLYWLLLLTTDTSKKCSSSARTPNSASNFKLAYWPQPRRR